MTAMARPPRIPNWLRWEQQTVYFITFCVERRKPVLANPRAWDIAMRVLIRLDLWTTLAVIAMPDHLHLLTAPLDREASVSAFSKWFKRWFDDEYWTGCVRRHTLQSILEMAGRLFRSFASF
jgi:REP element-mobilizing transposase RayT